MGQDWAASKLISPHPDRPIPAKAAFRHDSFVPGKWALARVEGPWRLLHQPRPMNDPIGWIPYRGRVPGRPSLVRSEARTKPLMLN